MAKRIVSCFLLFAIVLGCISCQRTVDIVTEPYLLDTGLVSRSICFENPSGAPGEGGKAASRLGAGRKGAPSISLKAGQEVQLCDIEPAIWRQIVLPASFTLSGLHSAIQSVMGWQDTL